MVIFQDVLDIFFLFFFAVQQYLQRNFLLSFLKYPFFEQ